MKLKDLSKKNKIIIIVGIVILFIALSPMIGKGIENTTRSLLLGLTTEQQIETVADVVDVNKLEAEAKLAEQQAVIDAQQVKLTEQQELIDEQKILVEKTKNDITVVSNASDCIRQINENNCNLNVYKTKDGFDKQRNIIKEDFSNRYDGWYSKNKPIFDKCQEILSKCD